VARRLQQRAQHHVTHLSLLASTRANLVGTRPPSLDAIIVPASRPAANLDHAVTLARALHCQLVVLCSLQARASDVQDLLASRNFDQAVVVDLPPDYSHPALDFVTSKWERMDLAQAYINPNSDLSTKRNLGLLLARLLGWERVFFMDDDIRDLATSDLYLTVAMLGPYHAVGMRAIDWPDNSVVCHGHRETGEFQDVFISGSLLAVQCTESFAFFPAIYNEDWFFFYPTAAARKLGWSERDATQLYYDPFDDPRRASGQEFGDLLAEGLYSLLHCGLGVEQAVGDYWRLFLDSRRMFLDAVYDRSEKVEPYLRQRIVGSIHAALTCSDKMTPSMCERYIHLWQEDLKAWQQMLKGVPRMRSVGAALRQLELEPSARSPYALARTNSGGGATSCARPMTAPIPPGPAPDLAREIRELAAYRGDEVLPSGPTSPAAGEEAYGYTRNAIIRVGRSAGGLARRVLLAE
jgi:hypothetical protein